MTRAEMIAESRVQGLIRDCAEFNVCGVDLCHEAPMCEALNIGDRTERVFVPVCDAHLNAVLDGERVEYVIDVHGCWPGTAASGLQSKPGS